jgi:hypothetical protein
MKTRGKLSLLFIIYYLFSIISVSAQESVYAPFVTRLECGLNGNMARLSWVDSADETGPVFIYRSTSPFTDTTNYAHLGRPVEIPYGVQSYIDELEAPGTYYYLIVASDVNSRKYFVPIAANNSIALAFEGSSSPAVAETGKDAPPPSVNGIRAEVKDGAVTVTFNEGDEGKAGGSIVLYRSVEPMNSRFDLVGAVIVQPDTVSPFTDYPVPGIPYYYAVVPENDLVKGTVNIMPGQNATTAAVTVPTGQGRVGLQAMDTTLRGLPLPLISLQAAVPGLGDENPGPEPQALSPEAQAAVKSLPYLGSVEPPPKKALVWSDDLGSPGGSGEEYALRSIVQGTFSARDWKACKDELLAYLALPRSGPAENRARFYLAQCRYFLGELRESIFDFLQVENTYPKEAGDWIDSLLLRIASLQGS